MPSKEQIVAAYCQVARPVIKELHPGRSCIAGARITQEVLLSFGLRSEPISLKLSITCEAKQCQFVTGLSPEEEARGREIGKSFVDERRYKEPYNGHVITIVENRWYIDTMFEECSVPQCGFVFDAGEVLVIDMAGYLPAGQLLKDQAMDAKVTLEDGTDFSVQWWPLDDDSFLDAPAWETDHLALTIPIIIDDMHRVFNGKAKTTKR